MGHDIGREDRSGDMPSRPRYGPLEVVVGERGVEAAIRLFKRVVLRDGILRDLKRRSHYEKPGDRRRRKARESVRRRRKQERRALAHGWRMD